MESPLERAAERFADVVHEAISVRVRVALELERDRHDSEIAELRDELLELARSLRSVVALLPDPLEPPRESESTHRLELIGLELEGVNTRMTSLASSVASLMLTLEAHVTTADPVVAHSVRVEP